MRGVKLPTLHPDQLRIAKEFSQHPRIVLRCGRRWGKTTLFERTAVKWAYQGFNVGWFGPDYKRVLPTYKRILSLLSPIVTSRSKVDMLIETKSKSGTGLVEFWTLNDEDAGRSRFYDLVLIDEASLASGLEDIWGKSIAPTLLDRGGRAIMAGTPKGINPDNYFYVACTNPEEHWIEYVAPTRNNPTLDQAGVELLQSQYTPLVYQQEFLAEFVDWRGAAFFSLDSMMENGAPVPWPARCDAVFAVIDTAAKTGKLNDGTAVTFFARNKYVGHPLIILDWDIIQIEGRLLETWLPTVFQRLSDMAIKCGARWGMQSVFIEDASAGTILLQQAIARGLPVEAIDSKLTSLGKVERAINISGYVFQGQVKISDMAFDKSNVNYRGITQNHFVSQVTGFRIGIKEQNAEDDLLDTFCYGVSLACGNAEGF